MEKVTVKDLFKQFELLPPKDMAPCQMLYDIFKGLFLDRSVQAGLVGFLDLSLTGDGTPVYTAARERKNLPVTVWKKASRTASATVPTASLTVTSDGMYMEPVNALLCIGQHFVYG